MVVIDCNSLILLILGFIDPNLINKHKRTSIYDVEDFYKLLRVIEAIENLVVLPNVWTEVDNLLNSFKGSRKLKYVDVLISTIKATSERYIPSNTLKKESAMFDLGITDSLLLELAGEASLLITSDSRLSDYATSKGILVYDLKKIKNKSFQ